MSDLDRWIRDHKRRKLKELRAGRPKSIAGALSSYIRDQLREQGFVGEILTTELLYDIKAVSREIVDEAVKKGIVAQLGGSDDTGPVGPRSQATQAEGAARAAEVPAQVQKF
jgi:hypothetical protein